MRSRLLVRLAWVPVLALVLMSCNPGNWRPVGYTEEKFGNDGMKKGPRTVTNITGNMKIVMPRLYYFYNEARARVPDLEGTVHMLIDVDWKGNITYVSVFKTTMNDEIFEDVLEATLIDHKFTKWRRGKKRTEIIYPLEFHEENAKGAPVSRSRKHWDRMQAEKSSALEEEQKKLDRMEKEEEDALWEEMIQGDSLQPESK